MTSSVLRRLRVASAAPVVTTRLPSTATVTASARSAARWLVGGSWRVAFIAVRKQEVLKTTKQHGSSHMRDSNCSCSIMVKTLILIILFSAVISIIHLAATHAHENMFGLRSNRGVKRRSRGSGHVRVDTPELIKKKLCMMKLAKSVTVCKSTLASKDIYLAISRELSSPQRKFAAITGAPPAVLT